VAITGKRLVTPMPLAVTTSLSVTVVVLVLLNVPMNVHGGLD